MLSIFINVALMLVAFILGYALQPKISRKISYKKRGLAAKKRAYVKKAARADGAVAKPGKLNGSANLTAQPEEPAKDVYLNGGTYGS